MWDTHRNLTIAAVVTTLLSVLGLTLWEVSPYNHSPLPHEAGWLGFPAWSLFGLALFVSFVGVAVDLVNQSMTHYHQKTWQDFLTGRSMGKSRYVWISLVVQGITARLYLLVSVTIGLTWAWDVMRCGVFFCLGDPAKYAPSTDKKAYKGDIINTVLGLLLFFVFQPMGVVLGVRIFLLTRKLRKVTKLMKAAQEAQDVTVMNAGDEAPLPHGGAGSVHPATTIPPVSPVLTMAPSAITAVPSEAMEGMRFYTSASLARQSVTCSVTLLVLTVYMLLGYYYPNDLHRLTAAKVASYAAETVSIAGVKNATSSVPEGPSAFFHTRVWSWNSSLRFKTFPGNCFFYTYLMLVVVIVWGLRQSQRGRHWMQRRVPYFPTLNFVEAGLAAGAVLLTILFFVYWSHDHNYKSVWDHTVDPAVTHFPTREIFARSMGQLASLFLSLLLLPVSRHSVLHGLLGTSWESFLFAHRALGYAFLLAMIIHALAFQSVFAYFGKLWHNWFSLPPEIGYRKVKGDFTVVLLQWWLGPLIVVCMGVGAYWKVRRQLFEVFYYSHLFASYATVGVVLLHAPSSWQYMLPGLTLWLIDRLVRLFQRSALVDVGESRVVSDDIVAIGFRVRGGVGAVMQRAYPGQYVFLNVIEVSALQWHPFTLSSVAGGGGAGSVSAPYTVHIKSMGPGTWTQRLYDRVARGEPLTLAVEGPCGSPLDVAHYDELFLVCGGIGVTPCASIFGSVLRWARAQACAGGSSDSDAGGVLPPATLPRRVKLIWACRSAQLVQAMAPSLGLPRYLHSASQVAGSDDGAAGDLSGWSSDTTFEVCLCVTSPPDFVTLSRLAEAEALNDGDRRRDADMDLPLPAPRERAVSPLSLTSRTRRPTDSFKDHVPCPGSSVRSAVTFSGVRPGRPLLMEELRPRGPPARSFVMACGPTQLVADTTAACTALGLPLRCEEFEL